MKLEEYGKENNSIIVMLHGANFVHCYGRQYPLANSFFTLSYPISWDLEMKRAESFTRIRVVPNL